ncbi:MAG TPA: sugar ABC transporter permease, partial [Firmicutes bacterium]|nr:sugar ABC transporter permease [Bacillota bacterium]
MNSLERKRYVKDTVAAYMYLAPALIVIIVFNLFPAFYALYISLFDTNLIGRWDWVGLGNYSELFRDADFLQSLVNTGKYVLGTVPVGMALALLIA